MKDCNCGYCAGGEKLADCTIESGKLGEEEIFAHIQTESWKAAFRDILDEQTLERCTRIEKATAMYRRLFTQGIGHGYLLRVGGKPHCIAWWDAARDGEEGSAELICIHSLPDNWGKGYGTKMIEAVLSDIRAAGYSRVVLWVFEENRRARRFYEACGFAPNGRVKTGLGAVEVCCEKNL